MKFEIGNEYKTRDGRKVIITAISPEGIYIIYGALTYFDGSTEIFSWTSNGTFLLEAKNHNLDLIPDPVPGDNDFGIDLDQLIFPTTGSSSMPIPNLPREHYDPIPFAGPSIDTSESEVNHKCICSISDLMGNGCKCGGK